MKLIGPKSHSLAERLKPEAFDALVAMGKDFPQSAENIWSELRSTRLASELKYWVAVRLRDEVGCDSHYDCFWSAN